MAITLMPSEIARLVYGYFVEMGCAKSAQIFLEESPHLKEFHDGIRQGRAYSTTINQKSLLQMLNSDQCNIKETDQLNDSSILTEQKTIFLECINSLEKLIKDMSNMVDIKSETLSVRGFNSLKEPRSDIAKHPETTQSSPRRKCATPRRIPNHSPNQTVLSASIECNESNPEHDSSPNTSSALTVEIPDVVECVVNPHLIYEELLKCKPLQEKLASKINKKITCDMKVKSTLNAFNINDNNSKGFGNIEKDLLPPEILEEILNSILEEPECDELVELVIEKEISYANTPCKLFSPTNPTSSNAKETGGINATVKSLANLNKNAALATNKSLTNELKRLSTNHPGTKDAEKDNQKPAEEVQHSSNEKAPLEKCKENTSLLIEKDTSSSSQLNLSKRIASPESRTHRNVIVSGMSPVSQPLLFPSQNRSQFSNEGLILTSLSNTNQSIFCLNNAYQIVNLSAFRPNENVPTNEKLDNRVRATSAAPSVSSINSSPGLLSKLPINLSSNLNLTSISPSAPLNNKCKEKSTASINNNNNKSTSSPIGNQQTAAIKKVTKQSQGNIVQNIVSDKKKQQVNNQASADIGAKTTQSSEAPKGNKNRGSKRKTTTNANESTTNKSTKRNLATESNDPKIKTLLNMDMDKFLGNIHSDAGNKSLTKKDSKRS